MPRKGHPHQECTVNSVESQLFLAWPNAVFVVVFFMLAEMKRCAKCGDNQPLANFHADRRRSRPQSYCRRCSVTRGAERRRLLLSGPEHRCRTCLRPDGDVGFKPITRKGVTKPSSSCVGCLRRKAELQRQYREQNPEKVREMTGAWRDGNRAYTRAYSAAYAKDHPAETLARKRWQATTLSDAYVRAAIGYGKIPHRLIPQELVRAKRAQLLIKRLLKENA